MSFENDEIHPYCTFISRTVKVGGLTKSQLIQKLHKYSILMNEYGERLFADDRFMTSATKYSLQTVELTVEDLGFLEGANTTQIYKRARELGLELCPLELGPYLRLEYLDQLEGYSVNPLQQQ